MEQTFEKNIHAVSFEAEQYLAYYEDTATWLAEVMEGSMYTSFEFRPENGDLVGQDGRSILSVLTTALEDAQKMADSDPRLSFELRRRSIEMEEYQDILTIANGGPDTLVVVSDFPPELMTAHEDVGGYNVRRKPTMLRVITRLPDGSVKMETQSLDGSNRQALERIYRHLGFEPRPGELLGQRMLCNTAPDHQTHMINELRQVYDDDLSRQYGGYWYAGQRPASQTNTYDFVKQQHDILDYVATQATKGVDPKSLYYSAAATIEKRMRDDSFRQSQVRQIKVEPHQVVQRYSPDYNVLQEMIRAGAEARVKGQSFSGCGVTIEGQEQTTADQLGVLGYGNQAQKSDTEEDQFGSLTFKCPRGHINRRPRNKLIPRCGKCNVDISCKV